jgi:hypothetical protein
MKDQKIKLRQKSVAATATKILIDGLAVGVAMAPVSASFFIGNTAPVANGVTSPKISLCHFFEENRFQSLLKKCEESARFVSDLDIICSRPEFREIVEIGEDAVPLILDEIERSPNIFLLSALEEITGEDPISPEDYGDVEKMVASWLSWANENREGKTVCIG